MITRCFVEVQTREQCACVCVCARMHAHVCTLTGLCLTLCDPVDCSLPGSSVHGIFQAEILGQVAVSHSRRSFQPRDQTFISCVSCTGRRILFFFSLLKDNCFTEFFCFLSDFDVNQPQANSLPLTTWEIHREERPHFKLCRGIIAFHSHLLSSDVMSDCQDKFMK